MDNRQIDLAKLICSTNWNHETTAESPDFLLTQFQGTAFASDYKCVKVITKGEPLVSVDGVFPQIFVAKITVEIERETLLEMKRRRIPVPAVYGAAACGNTTVLYEELIEGKELYQDENAEHWQTAARILAQVHSVVPDFKSERTFERIRDAGAACQGEPELRTAYEKAKDRLKHTRRTLAHGDMFPTNVLVKDDGSVVLIDWRDAGAAPYVCDLGRLTGMVDIDTLQPFCPCEDAVRDAYFEEVQDKLEYDQYVADFYAGQFVETAAYYEPGALRSPVVSDRRYAMAVRQRLMEIAEKLG